MLVGQTSKIRSPGLTAQGCFWENSIVLIPSRPATTALDRPADIKNIARPIRAYSLSGLGSAIVREQHKGMKTHAGSKCDSTNWICFGLHNGFEARPVGHFRTTFTTIAWIRSANAKSNGVSTSKYVSSDHSAAVCRTVSGTTRTAQNLNSGILPNGSRAGLVRRLAAAST
jgi:hypothetical protein